MYSDHTYFHVHELFTKHYISCTRSSKIAIYSHPMEDLYLNVFSVVSSIKEDDLLVTVNKYRILYFLTLGAAVPDKKAYIHILWFCCFYEIMLEFCLCFPLP